MKKSVTFIIVIIIILGAILLLTNPFKKQQSPFVPQGETSTQVSGSSEVGQKIPEFELEDFNGQKVKVATDFGKPIFIDFWAAWCPFCLEEMGEIEKINQEFKDKLVVLGIHRTETEDVARGEKFAKEIGVNYILLKDSTGQVYKTLTGGRNFMPYALYIDKQGTIVAIKAGPKTEEEMRSEVEKLLQENKGRQ